MVDPIFDYQFRLILIGDSTVGKSSLLKYFTDGKFAEVSSAFIVFLLLDKVFGVLDVNYALFFSCRTLLWEWISSLES